ncbi:PHP domain-containing protein [Fodinicurvata halophila]
MTDTARYAELQVASHFSFLRGASSCEELFSRAAELGIAALGLVDCNSLAGLVRAHVAAKESGVRLVVGCRLNLTDGSSLLVYPVDRVGYGRLCRLLTLGKQRAGKGSAIWCGKTWQPTATASSASSCPRSPTRTAPRGWSGCGRPLATGPTWRSPCAGAPMTSCACTSSPTWRHRWAWPRW